MWSGRCSITAIGRKVTFMKTAILLGTLTMLVLPRPLLGAIGCTLSNPAEDLKYLFPEMTSYKEDLKEFPRMKDGNELFKSLKERLASDLDPIYETFETPYTVYAIFKGEKKIGIVHGVNVPGKGGVIQVFLSTDVLTGAIHRLFFQRIESPAADRLKAKEFRSQFDSMTLADFYKHDYYSVSKTKHPSDKVARIIPPPLDENGKPDYEATLRGIRKNLILLDLFVYDRKYEPFFEKAKEVLSKKSAKEKT